MQTLEYAHRGSSLNSKQIAFEPDGSYTIVVAHRDPGPRFKNWLTTAGHEEGGMLFRWVEAKDHPPVETRLVKLEELASLP